MKYLVVLILVVFLVRIDWILQRFDLLSEKFLTRRSEVQDASTVPESPELIPMSQDKVFKHNPKQILIDLLNDFQSSPTQGVRGRIMQFLKQHPNLVTDKKDAELESAIYRWRDLLILEREEAYQLLIELEAHLSGENKLLVQRFLSLLIEINMDHFLKFYSQKMEKNCEIATMFGDPKSADEKITELIERMNQLRKTLENQEIDSQIKTLASNCLTMIDLEISNSSSKTQAGMNP